MVDLLRAVPSGDQQPASFAVLVFFVRRGAVDRVPHPGGDRPEQGQRHDEDEAVQALGSAEVAVLQAEAARLEVAEHGLNGLISTLAVWGRVRRPART